MIFLLFLFLGALFIISNGNLHLRDKNEFVKFSGAYYSWLSGLFTNAKQLTGYIAKSEWLPDKNNSLQS